MLSEKYFSKPEHKINFELNTKNRRLTDIRRGQQYLRKIDTLAENQWRNNEPRFKEKKPEYVTVRPITDTAFTKMKAERFMKESGSYFTGNKDYCEKRVLSERNPRSLENSEHLALDASLYSMVSPYTTLPRYEQSLDYKQIKDRRNNNDNQLFNQYGCTYSQLDDKLELTQKDFDPKFEPFRFRESMQRVVKPLPKKAVLMSRVGQEQKERQLKISTNFRSTHNGVVKVIKPPDPWPETSSGSKCAPVGNTNLQNEKTIVLLKRLDHFLNPDLPDKSSLGSSERDFPPSKSPCVSDFSDVPSDYQKIRDQARGPQQEVHFPENDRIRFKPMYKMYHKNISHPRQRKNNYGLKDLLSELDKKPMDATRKCRLWVSMCNSIKIFDNDNNS